MNILSIIYFSGSGHTTKMAEAVNQGAATTAGVTTNLIALNGENISQGRYKNDQVMATLDASDGIIFGTPTYMGGPAAQFKAFADATGERWYRSAWRNKIGAGFTVSSGPSGDKLSTLHYLFTLAMQHGMVWAGLPDNPMNDQGINRLSSYSGAMAQAGNESPDVAPNAADRLTGETLGRRVAEVVKRWHHAG